MQDRSEEVKKAVVAMTAAWQNIEHKDNNNDGEDRPRSIVMLLKCLDIENEGEAVGITAIKELYKAELLQLPAVDFSSLSSETALLWRVMGEVWKERKVCTSLYFLSPRLLLIITRIPPRRCCQSSLKSASPSSNTMPRQTNLL